MKSRGRWVAAATAVAALGGSLLVASPASADTALSGVVLDAGTPVENAQVYLYEYDSVDDEWDGTGVSAYTAADGTWSLSGNSLEDGTYAAYYYLDGTNVQYSTDQGWDGSIDEDDLTAQFTVSGDTASTPSLTENLVRNAGIITATVIDSVTGQPFAAAPGEGGYLQYYFYSGYNEDGYTNSSPNGSTSGAELSGNITLPRVLAGTYADGYSYASLTSTNTNYSGTNIQGVTVTAGATAVAPTLTLYPNGTASVGSTFANGFDPKITGVAKVGSLLTATTPTPTDPSAAATIAFQWYTDDHVIPGATSQTFTPTVKELGEQLYVEEFATLAGYTTQESGSDDTKAVKIGDANAGTVAIAGTAKYGNTVSAAVSATLAGANAFQWYLNGNPIAGADGSTYAIKATDVGSSLSVSVKSVVQGHTDAIIPSAGVLVTSDTANTGSIAITGTAKFGKTIKAAIATALPGVVSYKWFRNGTLVGGVDGSSYTIGKADLGKTVSVTATSAVQGHADAVLVATKVIAKDAASVKATAKGAKVTVTVKPGTTKISATAKVRVYYSSKKYTTITVKSGKSASVTLTKLKNGTHTVKVAYLGNASYAAKTVSVKVKK